jgi:hypothetical protein
LVYLVLPIFHYDAQEVLSYSSTVCKRRQLEKTKEK